MPDPAPHGSPAAAPHSASSAERATASASPAAPCGMSRAHVCLIGLRGAGKTSVGMHLAAQCGRPFHDLDELVLRRLGERSVKATFERLGEASWRAGETAALAAFLDAPLAPSVLALGGGAPMTEAVADRLRAASAAGQALVVHLDCPPEIAGERLSRDPGDRGSITGAGLVEELAALHRARIDRYRALAAISIDASLGSADAVAERLLGRIVQAARSCSSQPSPR